VGKALVQLAREHPGVPGLRRYLGLWYRMQAVMAMRFGEAALARQWAWLAVRYGPWQLRNLYTLLLALLPSHGARHWTPRHEACSAITKTKPPHEKPDPLASQQAPARLTRKAPLPFIALATGMLVSYLPGLFPGGVGVQLSYLGWMVPLLVCGVVALRHRVLSAFRCGFGLPWVLWVVAYLPFAEADNALQRGVMLLTPLVVGAGFSTLRVDAPLIDKFRCG
jgi:hypothetical protein